MKISDNICPTMVVEIQKCQKCMRNTSRDIIRYFSPDASEDPVCIGVYIHIYAITYIYIYI